MWFKVIQTTFYSFMGIITLSPLLYYGRSTLYPDMHVHSIFSRMTISFSFCPVVAHCEFHRKREIKRRKRQFKRALTLSQSTEPSPSSSKLDLSTSSGTHPLESAVQSRFASLKIGGRYQNPFDEWREQGAWEWSVLCPHFLKVAFNPIKTP